MRILHISDSHGEGETLFRLDRLVRELADVEVLAHTGDLVHAPEYAFNRGWDDWPQQHKLSVPGTHDGPRTYKRLSGWKKHDAPWHHRVGDLGFVGLDTSTGLVPFPRIDKLHPSKDLHKFSGLVVLTHEYLSRPFKSPDSLDSISVARSVMALSRGRPVLWLHGHDHNEGEGLVWDEKTRLGELTFFRSNVYSAHSSRKGCGHLITWDGRTFSHAACQG